MWLAFFDAVYFISFWYWNDSAGTILVTDAATRLAGFLQQLQGLLAGVVFPVELLPQWLRSVSNLLPTTHALHATALL
ncbi:MAG: hypothetical protein R3E31_28700 [Chloroflexota bacterium]